MNKHFNMVSIIKFADILVSMTNERRKMWSPMAYQFTQSPLKCAKQEPMDLNQTGSAESSRQINKSSWCIYSRSIKRDQHNGFHVRHGITYLFSASNTDSPCQLNKCKKINHRRAGLQQYNVDPLSWKMPSRISDEEMTIDGRPSNRSCTNTNQ